MFRQYDNECVSMESSTDTETVYTPQYFLEEGSDEVEMMEILEYGVPYSWRQEFVIQGFDPVYKGRKKFVEFCTHLKTWDKRTTKKGDNTSEEKTVTFLDTT